MNFTEINLNHALWQALKDENVVEATPIQQHAIPVAMSGRDLVGIAQTGTGKTFAYLIPLIRMWTFQKDRHARILVLVPTRELVLQVVTEAEKLAKYTAIIVKGIYGGTNLKTQALEVAEGADIIVGTPGRVFDMGLHGSLNFRLIKKVVIDEVDEMLNQGFKAQLEKILDLLPEKRQNLMFSATMPADVEDLINTYFNNPEWVEAASPGTPLTQINQKCIEVPNFLTKINLLKLWLTTSSMPLDKVLVFVDTKAKADLVYEALIEVDSENVGIIHSNKDQNYRFRAVSNFATGVHKLLIATDIMSRGLDIRDVSHVINLDIPQDPETYMHRIGRTGRYDKTGEAVSMAAPYEEDALLAIELFMQHEIEKIPLPVDIEISEKLIADELPHISMRNVLGATPKEVKGGGAYHERKMKNQKTNIKISYKEKMLKKYGKPKTRGAKKK